MDDEDDLEEERAEAGPAMAPRGGVATVVAELSGERVDAVLARALPALSRSRIQGLIGAGMAQVDGAPLTAASTKSRAGAVYTLRLPPPEPAAPQPEAIPLSIVYEDSALIVVDKAAGMAMHPAPGAMRGTLVHALLAHCGDTLSGIGGVARPGVVHRIDKDTTGLVVVAKHDAAHAGLAAQFAKHSIERAYFAVTRGAPQPRSAVIDTHLARSPDDRRKQAVCASPAHGKRAITHYWTIETFGQIEGQAVGRAAAAFVECRLHTGRTHQIRAHMAHIGCPLIGDPLYGKQRAFKAARASDALRAQVEMFSRQALHAAVLGFVHPETGAPLRFESPLPPDMAELLRALRGL